MTIFNFNPFLVQERAMNYKMYFDQYTEMEFTSFESGGFTIASVVDEKNGKSHLCAVANVALWFVCAAL